MIKRKYRWSASAWGLNDELLFENEPIRLDEIPFSFVANGQQTEQDFNYNVEEGEVRLCLGECGFTLTQRSSKEKLAEMMCVELTNGVMHFRLERYRFGPNKEPDLTGAWNQPLLCEGFNEGIEVVFYYHTGIYKALLDPRDFFGSADLHSEQG